MLLNYFIGLKFTNYNKWRHQFLPEVNLSLFRTHDLEQEV